MITSIKSLNKNPVPALGIFEQLEKIIGLERKPKPPQP